MKFIKQNEKVYQVIGFSIEIENGYEEITMTDKEFLEGKSNSNQGYILADCVDLSERDDNTLRFKAVYNKIYSVPIENSNRFII